MLDWNGLERRLGQELGRRYATNVISEIPRRIEQAHDAVAAGDSSRLERVAHILKGMAANLGAAAAQRAALAVEEAARTGTPHLPALVASMATAMSQVVAALEEKVAQMPKGPKGASMRILVAEDDFSARMVLQHLLKEHGSVDVAVNGREAVDAFRAALEAEEPYQVVCLDIMMPEMDGLEALREIRATEARLGIASAHGAKIIMTTALDDPKNVIEAFKGLCDTYLVKPIDKENLRIALVRVGVIGGEHNG